MHLDEDQVLDLVLGHVDAVTRDRLAEHLAGCAACRRDVDELATGVELVLPAAPAIGPPAGFEDRVMGVLRPDGVGERPGRRLRERRRPVLLAAAAAALGVVAGAGVTLAVVDQREPPPAATTSWSRALLDEAGTAVGTVSPSYGDAGAVLVVDVADAVDPRTVVCRMVLEDGTASDVATWDVVEGQPNSWVLPAPDSRLAEVQLVDDAGQVWSSATF